jgi:hypothetical protein
MWTIEPRPRSLDRSCHGATIGAIDRSRHAEDSFADEISTRFS